MASLITPEQREARRKSYLAEWYIRNREKRLIQTKANYQANRAKRLLQSKIYHENHPEVARKSTRAYLSRNKSKCRARCRNYYQRNKEKLNAKSCAYHKIRYQKKRVEIRSKQKAHYEANADSYRARARLNRLKNLEKRREQCREWHRAHRLDPDFIQRERERARVYFSKTKDQSREHHKKWRKNNPGHWRALRQKRRALEKSSAINLTSIREWMVSVKSKQSCKCYYCQRTIPTKGCHFDHIVPLSKGGPHSVDNLCVSCPKCNLSKHAHRIEAWVRIGQQVLSL